MRVMREFAALDLPVHTRGSYIGVLASCEIGSGAIAMLKRHADRTCVVFAVDHEVRLLGGVAEADDQLRRELKPAHVNIVMPSGYNLAFPARRYYFTLMLNRIMWQSLGVSEWRDNWNEHLRAIQTALRMRDVQRCSRVGFKVTAYIPLQMAHSEICRLMFGAFLSPLEDMDAVLKPLNDPLVQFQGECGGVSYLLVLSAMSRKQAVESFRSNRNLELFLGDKLTDSGIRDFQQRLESSDCLFFDIDVSRTEVPVEDLSDFVTKSLVEADRMVEASVRQLQSKPSIAR